MSGIRGCQFQVLLFHGACDLGIGNESDPQIRNGQLRIDLMKEEFEEFESAVWEGDLVKAVDAICDVIFVALGAAVEFGVDIEGPWQEVVISNMAKVGGPMSPTGKLLKPPGWKGPDIAACLERQRKR